MSTAALRRTPPVINFPQSAPARGAAVVIERLSKSFGDNQVLRGVDLRIDAGEFVAVVGRSGCGKSTLLRLLLKLEEPTGGRFRFQDGNSTLDERSAGRVMFQEPRLLPWASVIANVEVGLGAERKAPDARQRAIDTLRAVDLASKQDQWPAALSGGQKQRVALARALVSRPRFLALDEPLGALDALTRISMQKLLERIWLEERFTALLVTHDVTEAIMLADRVVMIDNGEVTLDLTVDLPRPRPRGSADVAALEKLVLDELFRE